MTDIIKFNNQDFEVKRKLSFGEVRKFQKILGSIIGLDKKIRESTPEELEVIANDSMRNTGEQMEMVEQTLKNCLGFSQEDLEKLSFNDAIILFNQVFTDSTQIKKKSVEPYV